MLQPPASSSRRQLLALVPKTRPIKARLGSLAADQASARRLIDYVQLLVYTKPFKVRLLEKWARVFAGADAERLAQERTTAAPLVPLESEAALDAQLRELLERQFGAVPPEQLAGALYHLANVYAGRPARLASGG